MQVTLLKSKIHRATVTDSDLNYEGSIAIDTELIKEASLHEFEKVDIYNINNGERFSTYVIPGKKGEMSLNGAAARLVHKGDLVIIASYANYTPDEAKQHKPVLVFVNKENSKMEIK
ncbi:MAG: aspartate 1-decarboxylase [Melioribacteraceae bacterium]|nr:aspartate 1-decarboxylase [Melioribacteraceae bacterium]MCF8353703.1 aspartate 1-decarboxylase [Melioribacteraceae bacterium]MCF8394956.1 aspartate 1-decarboxylase [Melioribacteraceae bacterium]MCF8418619.1 aspartate 1-decarboxylase [Melioribacteraceae bacterium]